MNCCKSNTNRIWTDFYKNIQSLDFIESVEEPDFNYDNYSILSLKTILSEWIHENWDNQIYLTFPAGKKDTYPNRSYLTIQPMIGNDELIMDQQMIDSLQKEVNKLTITDLKSVLVIGNNNTIILDSGVTIPSSWIKEMLPYVPVNPELNPYVAESGLFVQISHYPDFSEIYTILSINIEKKLKQMFTDGYVYKPQYSIIQNWQLITHEMYKEVYYPLWTDRRITNSCGGKYQFIKNRMNGINTIDYFVDSNNVVKHTFVSLLQSQLQIQKIKIMTNYVRVQVDNLNDAQRIASLVEYAEEIASGHIILKFVSSSDSVKAYKEIALVNEDKLNYKSIVSYQTEYLHRPYAVSFLFPYNLNFNILTTSTMLWNLFMDYKLNEPLQETVDTVILDKLNIDTLYQEIEYSTGIEYPENIQYGKKLFTLVPHHLSKEEIRQAELQDRLQAERLEREKLQAERLEREKLQAERLEREIIEREQSKREKIKKERIERERSEREKIEILDVGVPLITQISGKKGELPKITGISRSFFQP